MLREDSARLPAVNVATGFPADPDVAAAPLSPQHLRSHVDASWVRQLLQEQVLQRPSLAMVAGQLHMSTRTLKRRLREQGLSFRQLLDAARLQASIQLLRDTESSVEHVAWRVGYSCSANFARAFQRWAGMAPAHWRRKCGDCDWPDRLSALAPGPLTPSPQATHNP